MKAKKGILIFIMMSILATTTSCFNDNNGNNENKVDKAKEDKIEIKMDVLSSDKYTLAAIRQFNETHKNIIISYADAIPYNEDYKNKYIASLSAGEGPDIIRADNESGLLTAIQKTANSGIFYNLNELIDKDNNFKLSDYNQKVMDSGIIDGKRFLMPICYDISTYFAKDGVLSKNGFTTDGEKYTLKNFADEVYTFMKKNKDTGKYFMTLHNFTLSDILKISGLNLVNNEKKAANFDSKEFVDVLKIYKKINAVKKEFPQHINYYVSYDDKFDSSNECPDFDNGKALIINNIGSELWFRDRYNKKVNTYIFPQHTKEKSILLKPMVYFAINSKCKYKEGAFEFIKSLLSEENQKLNSLSYMPVNNEAYLNSVNFYISNLDNAKPVKGEYDAEIRKAQVKEQYTEIQKISVCDTVDVQIYSIIDGEAKSLVDGKYSAEQTAKNIQEKVMLYMNE